MTLSLPKDFSELLTALQTARRVARPVVLHDDALAAALKARALIEPRGAGWLGTAVLDGFLALPDASRIVAAVVLAPATEAPAVVAPAVPTASAPASAPATQEPSFDPTLAHCSARTDRVLSEPLPESTLSLRALEEAVPHRAQGGKVLGAVEEALLKHVQVLDVHIDGLRRQMDALLEQLEPALMQLSTKAQKEEYAAKLPPSALKQKLEAAAN